MTSCVPEGRNLTCCLSSQSLHPLLSLDYRQVEAYRASERHKILCLCVCLCASRPCTAKWHHVTSVLQKELHYFCLLSTKRDTQAHTAKCEYKLNTCPILTVKRCVFSFTQLIHLFFYPVTCLSRAWEAPEKLFWICISNGSRDCN